MGRRRYKKQTGRGADYSEIERTNKAFEEYYKEQGIVPADQWDQFLTSLKTNLPATFRITGFRSHAKHLLKFLKGHYFSELINQTIDGVPVERPQPLTWFPDELAWHFNLTRQNIRKIPALEKLHKFLITETESGNISRQEAVSMIPPLLMDVQSHHKVLDMCAAPGSKTAQLIEMLHADMTQGWPEGFVIANDADNKRCYIMVHQAKRLNSPCCMIVNQDAAFFPNIKVLNKDKKPQRIRYDRVLCDVPCSGDGTMRKNYVIWKKWTVYSGLHLHSLQGQILKRGVEVLEVGGRLVYSTCSFNPLENEAVIANVLRQCEGAVELVDVSNELPGLKRQPGMTTWKVINEKPEIFPDYESVPEDKRQKITRSMFPPTPDEANDMQLTRCIRLLPHHQDTGGFFVAVLKKTKHLPWTKEAKKIAQNEVEANEAGADVPDVKKETTGDHNAEGSVPNVEKETTGDQNAEGSVPDVKKEATGNHNAAGSEEPSSSTGDEPTGPPSKKARYTRVYKEDPFVFFKEDEQIWPQIRQFYGVDDAFPVTQLLTRCHVGKKRNVYFVNEAVKQILQNNEDSLRVINSGVKTWCRSDAKGVDCAFRLAQDGILCLFPYLSLERKITITKEDVIVLLTQENPFYHKFTENTQRQVNAITMGSVVFIYDPKNSDQDSDDITLNICGWKGKTSCRSFVAKGDRHHILRMCGVADTAIYAEKPGSSRNDRDNAGTSGGWSKGASAAGNEGKNGKGSEVASMEVSTADEKTGEVKMECDSTENETTNQIQSAVSMSTENTEQNVDTRDRKIDEAVSSTQQDDKAIAAERVDRTESKQAVTCSETSEAGEDTEKK